MRVLVLMVREWTQAGRAISGALALKDVGIILAWGRSAWLE